VVPTATLARSLPTESPVGTEPDADGFLGLLTSSSGGDISPPRSLDLLLGELSIEGESLLVEFPWPNNLPLDQLRATAPIGTELIVLAQNHRTAATLSGDLIEQGLSRPIAPNLVQVTPWGMVARTRVTDANLAITGAVPLADAARSIGADVRGFDDLVELLQRQR